MTATRVAETQELLVAQVESRRDEQESKERKGGLLEVFALE
jgi:hypothetical protein